jgi:hypothetical protein
MSGDLLQCADAWAAREERIHRILLIAKRLVPTTEWKANMMDERIAQERPCEARLAALEAVVDEVLAQYKPRSYYNPQALANAIERLAEVRGKGGKDA